MGLVSDEVIDKAMGYLPAALRHYGPTAQIRPPWALRRFAGLKAMHDTILFPVNSGGVHWVLAQYSFADGTARWWDSQRSGGINVPQTLKSELAAVVRAIWGAETPCVSRIKHSQPNTYDCGLYVLYHADLLTRRPDDPLPKSLSSADLRNHYRQVSSEKYVQVSNNAPRYIS
ncbi:hypothetical protein LY76DRAFT_610468 [Colletotrichum caudatum]|nr:hypothetical protein LY76DRAFT_610468 [Colletotrichum caudatum]